MAVFYSTHRQADEAIHPYPVPLCLSHLCSSLSWDVNHRMRPAAGKRLKRIADERRTRMFWPLFCIISHLLKSHATHQGRPHAAFFNVFKFISKGAPDDHVSKHPSLFKFYILSVETGKRMCQAISNQVLSWISTPAQSLPSPDLRWGGVGETDYIWQPKPF